MDIYDMFALCAPAYFKMNFDLELRNMSFRPDSDDIVLKLDITCKGENICMKIQYDENGAPLWLITIGEKAYQYNFDVYYTFDIIRIALSEHHGYS